MARDFSGTADPFCRLCLLPNRKSQLQSRVHKKTLNPEFEEEFIFDVPATELSSRTLEILMFDYDQFSHDECVGQIQFPLEQFNPTEKGNYWKGLSTYEKKTEVYDRKCSPRFFFAYCNTTIVIKTIIIIIINMFI